MKIFRFIAVAFLLGWIIVIGIFGTQETTIAKQLHSMDENDRRDLEIFFRSVIYQQHLGYTLFGDKPVSIAGYFIQEPTCNVYSGCASKISMHKLWQTWKKHEKNFDVKNYIILNEPNTENNRTITLINKQAFKSKVAEFIDDFRAILGKDITPEILLSLLTVPNASLFETLHRNEILYGILLGFGKENALLFKRRFDLIPFVGPGHLSIPIHEHPDDSYSLKLPHPSPPFKTLEEEYAYLNSQMDAFDLDPLLSPIDPPRFIALKDSPETLALKQKYRTLQRKLVKVYSEGDFLTITLEQLCH